MFIRQTDFRTGEPNSNKTNEIKHKVDKIREKLSNEIKSISAESIYDLVPAKNLDFAFKIELNKNDQEPLVTRCRPLPYQIKEKYTGSTRNTIVGSENGNEYTSYLQEQKKDSDIVWISSLIEKFGEEKPEIEKFENVEQRLFYKEYDKLRLVENVLYRMYEDKNGLLINQFVMPKQIEEKIIKHIHESIFNGHLGRNKTMEKVTSRFYRPYIRKTFVKKSKILITTSKPKY
ncbi:Retrovirus-related Pol poly from transposon [Brachionus plicatilis]|uniref:Retrovirus-related Pol poly from transposon n=1 Tax=Brachionus plicatilis TaxID=10195 RepID=A0A3M7S8H9_BRAPC|nr:Retrovirus-related Pol poly from transposon [Brachionus plicatilis]